MALKKRALSKKKNAAGKIKRYFSAFKDRGAGLRPSKPFEPATKPKPKPKLSKPD